MLQFNLKRLILHLMRIPLKNVLFNIIKLFSLARVIMNRDTLFTTDRL